MKALQEFANWNNQNIWVYITKETNNLETNNILGKVHNT